MDFLKINGRVYDVVVTAINENFNILYGEGTGRTIAKGARMTLAPLGTFYGHKVTVKRKQGKEAEFDRLFMEISKPRYDGIPVEAVHNQTTISYDAYISNGARDLKWIDRSKGIVYWNEMEINIIPMEAQVLPE